MKQIKQLCLNKLQSMREEDILSVIEVDDSTLESSLNNTLLQLLGAPTTSGSRHDDRSVERDNVTQSVKCDSGGDWVDRQDKAIEIAVSDISDDEHKENTVSKSTPDTYTVESDHKRDSRTNSPAETEEGGSKVKAGGGGEGSDSSDSEQEDLSGVNPLLEMELRQRALESALKKASGSQLSETQNNVTAKTAYPVTMATKTSPSSEDDTTNSPSTKAVASTPSYSGEGGPVMATPGGLSPSEVGEMLEQRMRERLLQSLAAKRK